MDKIIVLKKAIKLRRPIEFEYNREDKVAGKRFGNPHIIFIHPDTRLTSKILLKNKK